MNACSSPVNSDAVFVMGLPRSGSTLLSRLLNSTPDILSVNDLYFVQKVIALRGLEKHLSHEQTEQLLDTLVQVIDKRVNKNDQFIGQFQVTSETLDAIKTTILSNQRTEAYCWHRLLDDVLTRVAQAGGKTRWSDKTPQNFYHLETLAAQFPKAKFVFLFRDPRAILASFKYAKGEGHDARRYHPGFYSLYWRSAVRYFMQVRKHERVLMVRYEDLVSDTAETCARLDSFLGTRVDVPELATIGHNSSFEGGARKGIDETETWACQRLCGKEMDGLGYQQTPASPRMGDLPGMLRTSATFAAFQFSRVLGDSDARKRALTYMRGLGR